MILEKDGWLGLIFCQVFSQMGFLLTATETGEASTAEHDLVIVNGLQGPPTLRCARFCRPIATLPEVRQAMTRNLSLKDLTVVVIVRSSFN